MKCVSKISIFIFLTFALNTAHGQNSNITREFNVTPVTPEAAALAKMVNYPISYNTGIPDIRIPLYEIKTGGMVLPIELVYHSGGFKINEQAGRVGLGWSLNCDLQITRTIYGTDDFGSGGYLKDNDMKQANKNYTTDPWAYPITNPYGDDTHLMKQYELATGTLDGMPDKFYYKLLNKSGSFFFHKDSSGTSYAIVPVPFDNIKIKFNNGAFVITDTDGTVYYFGYPGNPPDVSNDPASYGIEFSGKEDGITMLPTTRTTWKCMRIDDVNFSGSISFTYSKQYEEGSTVYAGKKTCTYQDKIEYRNTFNYDFDSFTYPRKYADEFFVSQDVYENLLDGCQCQFFQLSSPKYMVSYGGVKKEFHLPYIDNFNEVIDKIYAVRNDAGPNHDPLKVTNYINSLKLDKIEYRGGKVEFIGDVNKISTIKITDNQKTKTIQLYQKHTVPNELNLGEAKDFNGAHFLGTNYLDSVQIGDDKYILMYRVKYMTKI